MSHPTWVRGLKLRFVRHFDSLKYVAPYVGAWIETYATKEKLTHGYESHPTWVRGLKLDCLCHLLRDTRVAPYVGAWIET